MRNEEELKNFFNKLADNWDKNEKKQTHTNLQRIISLIKLKKYDRVVDIGCGTGICYPYLKKIFKNYVGIDISDKMIKIAKKKFPDAKFINANFYRYRFPENFYDLAIVFNSFPHFEKKEFFLKKIKRILKTAGKIVIAHSMKLEKINKIHTTIKDIKIQKHIISSKEILELFKITGFKNIKIIEKEYFYIEGTKR